MKRNSDLQKRFPAFYNHEMLKDWRTQKGLEIQDVSRDTGIPYASIQRAELGIASNKIIYPLASYYGKSYQKLFRLPGLALAATGNGGSLSAG